MLPVGRYRLHLCPNKDSQVNAPSQWCHHLRHPLACPTPLRRARVPITQFIPSYTKTKKKITQKEHNMFGHNYTYDHSSEFLNHYPLADTTTLTPSPLLPRLAIPGDENDAAPALRSELGCTSSGRSSSITNYYVQCSPTLIQRSISSHSLLKNSDVSPINTSAATFLEPTVISSVRKASNTGDLLVN